MFQLKHYIDIFFLIVCISRCIVKRLLPQVIDHLPNKPEVLSSSPRTTKKEKKKNERRHNGKITFYDTEQNTFSLSETSPFQNGTLVSLFHHQKIH
jgi:hypothetical protein